MGNAVRAKIAEKVITREDMFIVTKVTLLNTFQCDSISNVFAYTVMV